jgi:hypothetical protein
LIILYVLKGKTGKRYAGITNNLTRRLKEHPYNNSKGGQLLGGFFINTQFSSSKLSISD